MNTINVVRYAQLLEFDAEIERLESHHQALVDHYNSGKSVMDINFYR